MQICRYVEVLIVVRCTIQMGDDDVMACGNKNE